MTTARTGLRAITSVKLELLRHGPPHNQLLSPLTEYLALSGDHEACTVRVPWEHANFLQRLSSLRYGDGDLAARQVRVREVASEMCHLLAAIPGLAADLRGCGGVESLTHLRLVFSASELALLPYELAVAPNGFPGEGTALALQLDAPLVITRETRAAAGRAVVWPRRPRILFAVAAPLGGIEPELVLAHFQALRLAMRPYYPAVPGRPDDPLVEHIRVLGRASYRAIEQACASEAFTHVHILAHGCPCDVGGERRYGLALHSSRPGETLDPVDGERLAHALRAHRGPTDGLSHPTVVTLAACDSGQTGSVLLPGSSLAHTLHEASVPLVVASQFPLSKRGSVVMAQVLYTRLLRGDDPRIVLHDLRQRLHGLDGGTHDWASLVAYAALPTDLDNQLRAVATDQAIQAMRVAMFDVWRRAEAGAEMMDIASTTASSVPQRAHASTRGAAAEAGTAPGEPLGFSEDDALEDALRRLDRAIAGVPGLTSHDEDRRVRALQQRQTDVIATVAAIHKRKAEYLWLRAYWLREQVARDTAGSQSLDARAAAYLERSEAALRESYAEYSRAWALNPASHWAGMAVFALRRHLTRTDAAELARCEDLWRAIRLAIEGDKARRADDPEQYVWARSAEIELLFHAAFTPALRGRRAERPEVACLRAAKDLASDQGQDSEAVRSTRYQMRRYVEWWYLSPEHAALAREAYLRLGGNPERVTALGRSERDPSMP